eukprot:5381875-Ditylum_brightwellii.AAC.1
MVSLRILQPEEVKRIFNVGYTNATNVPAMVKLYWAIADMAELDLSKFDERKTEVEAVWDELRLM